MKIRAKLIFSFVFLIILTAALYGFAAYTSITKPLRALEKNTSLQYSRLIVSHLNEILEHAIKDMSLVSANDLLDYIHNPDADKIHTQEDRFNLFSRSYIKNIAFVTADQHHPLSLHPLDESLLVTSEKYLESTVIFPEDSGTPLLRISSKIFEPQEPLQGVGFVFLDLQEIFQKLAFKNDKTKIPISIRDREGRLVYSSTVIPVDQAKLHLTLPYTRNALSRFLYDKESGLQTEEITDESGKTILIGSILPALGFPMFIDPDYLGLETIVSSMSWNMLMVGVAIVWVAVWTAMIIGYKIMKPIEDLSQGAERIASGQYHYRLHLKRKDEIGHMAQKFNDMAEAVEKRSKDLEQSNEALKEQDAEKTRFLDIVAHDLRTPLTSIKAYADLLLRFPDEAKKTRDEFLEIILTESNRMASLINDYLDLTKLESGTLVYRFQQVDLTRMIREFVKVSLGACSVKQLRIQSNIMSALPLIQADPDRLSQVFSNLLSNAIRHTPSGGEIRVEAKQVIGTGSAAEKETEWIQVSLTDQGPGIPEEYHEIIFDKFRQLDSQSLHSKGGAGLGLPISKEIITRHGGRIWVENQNGNGARFIFQLPVKHTEDTTTS